MKQPTVTHYFLGANSKNGFFSLYDQFCSNPNDMMHIIKSGPGTGKSTFMKRIGKAAEQQGYDVEYILCSGDPDSLDGVYIPALHTGWADGTAPHVLEPKLFGVTADYINLGQFCDHTVLDAHRSEIAALNDAYKDRYRKAYHYLAAAGTLAESLHRTTISDASEMKLRKRAQAKIQKELTGCSTGAKPVKRFLSAISCQGTHTLSLTLGSLCDRLCVLESHFGLEQVFFREILDEITARQAPAIICPQPLCPENTEAVLLPEQRLCFIASNTLPEFTGKIRTIHLDAYLDNISKSDSKVLEKQVQQLTELASGHLAQAKHLHDALEAYYRPALMFHALDDYTQSVLASIK